MHLFDNHSCMRWNNFKFLFLAYLPVFKQYSIKKENIAQRKDLIITTFSLPSEWNKVHFML